LLRKHKLAGKLICGGSQVNWHPVALEEEPRTDALFAADNVQ
jgi:hypothetical protein